MRLLFSILALLTTDLFAMEPCTILNSHNKLAEATHDGLSFMLMNAAFCPQNIIELDGQIVDKGWEIFSYMVANRGRNNPRRGSFSFFELAEGLMPDGNTGEIFLGHFTGLDDNTIVLDQSPDENKLLIEAIAFDQEKGLYNFYELMSQGNSAQWFYRGDSRDALLDNKYLYRTPPVGQDKFGERMRCSACHNNGEPIMKELSYPHNDWWSSSRPLIFAPNELSDEVLERVNNLHDAADFSNRVIMAAAKLSRSKNYQRAKNARSWQEILRPLFCATEINLLSSDLTTDSDEQSFSVPSAYILNPIISSPTFNFPTKDYRELLDRFKLRFPENGDKDADHMWLTPVVSLVDRRAITALINENIITEKNALDILMIDFMNPLFSEKRCGLLKFIPSSGPEWFPTFLKNLRGSDLPEAKELLRYLFDVDSYFHFHESVISSYIENLNDKAFLEKLFQRLIKVREQAFVDEISLNPQGQILEPGFRVIFPRPMKE